MFDDISETSLKKSAKTSQLNFMEYKSICRMKKEKKKENKKKTSNKRRYQFQGNLIRSYFVLC